MRITAPRITIWQLSGILIGQCVVRSYSQSEVCVSYAHYRTENYDLIKVFGAVEKDE
jgi:hypothetical protein